MPTQEWMIHERRCPALAPHGIVYLGRSEAEDGFAFSRTDPPFHLVLGCTGGFGEASVGGLWRPLGPGQALVATASQPHAYRWVGPGRWCVWWIVFRPSFQALDRFAQEPSIVTLDADRLDHGVRAFLAEHGEDEDSPLNHHYAALIQAGALRALGRRPPDPRLSSLWAKVDEAPSRTWSNRKLAGLAGLGEEQLRRLTQRDLGRSPLAHVTHLRMRRAALSLVRTRSSVEAIAAEVGYTNAFAFSAAFKRWAGLSPSMYRRSLFETDGARGTKA